MNENIHPLAPSDELDLHNFRPCDAQGLIHEFIWSCKENRIYTGSIIHGKGTGSLRKLTHSELKKNKLVKNFHVGSTGNLQNWGKTTRHLAD
jgi:DNA mismatch repair protein MutS2